MKDIFDISKRMSINVMEYEHFKTKKELIEHLGLTTGHSTKDYELAFAGHSLSEAIAILQHFEHPRALDAFIAVKISIDGILRSNISKIETIGNQLYNLKKDNI